MNKNTMLIVTAVLIVAAAIGGFYAGIQYQKSNAATNSGFGRKFSQNRRFVQNGQTFSPVRGRIISIGNNSMTVKLSDQSTKIVILSAGTAFIQSQKASKSDLKTGDVVNVLGTANSDGSVTAQEVSINPLKSGGIGGKVLQSPQTTTGAGY